MKPVRVFDLEIYKDYFLAAFRDVKTGKHAMFEMFEDHPFDITGVRKIIKESTLVSFNGINFDMPLLSLALKGADNATIKQASDAIIVSNLRSWQLEQRFKFKTIQAVDHIDLIEVAPGMVSLKIYGGRLHLPRMQDLPFAPDAVILPEQRMPVKTYCRNDLMVTSGTYYAVKSQIDLRRVMSADLGVDIRSKSDAQIAETVLTHAINKQYGFMPRKQPLDYKQFTYTAPSYISFGSDNLNELLATLSTAPMKIKETGHVEMPAVIENFPIEINGRNYKIGIGGIHSQESEVSHYADDNTLLRDIDVVSYYPNLILNMGMYPPAMGPHFLKAYRDILDKRVIAKRAKDKVTDSTLKITLNGTFGKTSNKYSILYNPSMMIHTTLTGQLSLLMLIEALEKYGIPVVSANTDGIVVKFDVRKEPLLRKIVSAWEKRTNLETDETHYKAIHARDVNNYIAIKTDGSVKAKGFFAPAGLAKNPQNEVCNDAVIAYLTNGTKLATSIRGCHDIRKFLTLRTVNGGAVKEGYTLGKAIRWYYAVGETGTINYRTNGNIVARSEGAKPLMDLPPEMPKDVDYDWYIREANDLLMDLGVVERPPVVKLPRKNSKAWKQMVEEGLINV